MPTNETLELCSALRSELTLPIAELVVNAHLPTLFPGPEREIVARLGELAAGSAAQSALASGARRALRERIQEDCLRRLNALGAPLRTLDFLPTGAATPAAVALLARKFAATETRGAAS
jgi:hypothetical protein